MNKPTITISLKPHLADFCRHEFNEADNAIIINRKHDIGKFITSHILMSDLPVTKSNHENKVTFILPLSSKSDLTHKFLYVSEWGVQKIQDYIEAQFNLYIRFYFDYGRAKEMSQKLIIESILTHYNIRNTALNYEAIKKNDYRHNRRIRKIIATELLTSFKSVI